jgi:uncharacterized membrane protein
MIGILPMPWLLAQIGVVLIWLAVVASRLRTKRRRMMWIAWATVIAIVCWNAVAFVALAYACVQVDGAGC